jgi:hypothetical protein
MRMLRRTDRAVARIVGTVVDYDVEDAAHRYHARLRSEISLNRHLALVAAGRDALAQGMLRRDRHLRHQAHDIARADLLARSC